MVIRNIKKEKLLPLDYISWLSFMGFAMSSVIIGLCLPEISHELNLNSLQGGSTESLRNLALILSLMVLAAFASRWGKKIFGYNGQYLLALGLLCISFSNSYPTLLLSLILLGLGGGAIEGLINPLIIDLHPKSANRYVNLANAFFPLGVVIAAISFGQLLYMDVSWRIIFRIAAAYSFFIGILFHINPFPKSQDNETFNLNLIWRILKRPVFWYLAIALFLAAGIESSFTFWSRTYISNFLSDNIRMATFSIVIFSSFMAIGRMMSVKLSEILSETSLMLLSAILGIIASIFIPFANDVLSFYFMLAFSGLSIACFWPIILVAAARFIQTNNTTLFALLALFGIFGFGFFPTLIGYIGQLYNLKVGLIILPIAFTLLIFLLFLIQKHEKNQY